MKISELKINVSDQQVKLSDNKKVQSVSGDTFKSQLISMNQDYQYEYLIELKDKIINQGNILSKNINIKELKKYRELISEFFNEISKNAFKLTKESTFDSRGRHKLYYVINNVNKKLDDLSAEIINNQIDNIQILDTIDSIKGIIINLLI